MQKLGHYRTGGMMQEVGHYRRQGRSRKNEIAEGMQEEDNIEGRDDAEMWAL